MPLAFRSVDGAVAKNSLAEGEAAQYEALKRAVHESEERKKEEERQRRLDLGLPAELTEEERREEARKEKERRKNSKERNLDSWGKRVFAKMCFGS